MLDSPFIGCVDRRVRRFYCTAIVQVKGKGRGVGERRERRGTAEERGDEGGGSAPGRALMAVVVVRLLADLPQTTLRVARVFRLPRRQIVECEENHDDASGERRMFA
jgi:hypothetical protein